MLCIAPFFVSVCAKDALTELSGIPQVGVPLLLYNLKQTVMTDELTITAADNGVMLTGEDWVQVIENTHSNDDARYDNLILELGKLFKDLIDQTMNQEIANTVKVKVEITKVE